MILSGTALWAGSDTDSPRWTEGSWIVEGDAISRVDDEIAGPVHADTFIVPGMVDAHCHIGFSEDGPVSQDEMVAQSKATLASGVTLVRDCGVPVDNSGVLSHTALRVIRCGRHVARPKRYLRGLPIDVDQQCDLPGVVADMATHTEGWVKLVGDWIDRSGGSDSDLMPLWDPHVLADAVDAAHDCGARVAVHAFSHRVIDSLIEAGVDCIEHGSGIDADQAQEIASRGIAVTPTLRQVELFAQFAEQAGVKYPVYANTMMRMFEGRRAHFEMLIDAGVLLLMGTDSGGYQDHGSIVGELALWTQWGASSRFVLDSATWLTRRFLGYGGLSEGAVADFLVLDEDPLDDPLALSRPARVYVGGVLAWERVEHGE